MATDILGPANAVNVTTIRPAETRIFGGADTFFKPCSSPSALDGTAVQAVFLNGILQQLRRAIRGMGVAENTADDDMLLKAIQAASAGLVPLVDALANLPIHALVGASGLVTTTAGTGSLVVSTGQNIVHRGIKSYDLGALSVGNRTFATAVSKTYHLRWYPPGLGRAIPAASWPVGRLYLEDLADAGYNPSAVAETNAAFDSSFDNVLLARVVTNGANALTVTPLLNKHQLAAAGSVSGPSSAFDAAYNSLFSGQLALNWARSPAIATVVGNTVIAGGTLEYANWVHTKATNRYAVSATVQSNWNEGQPYTAPMTGFLQFDCAA